MGRTIENIKLPQGTSISAIVRGNKVMQAHHDTVVEENDHVILFMTDRRHIDEVERLFQTEYLTLDHAPRCRSTHPWTAADGIQHHDAAPVAVSIYFNDGAIHAFEQAFGIYAAWRLSYLVSRAPTP